MKKIETIIKEIKKDKKLFKKLEKVYNKDYYKNLDSFIIDIFINNAIRYVKALKNNRVIYIYQANSYVRILESTKNGYLNFNYMFYLLDKTDKTDKIRCNNSFNFNYNLIHKFKKLGIITKKECEVLSQKINFMY